MFHQSVLSLGKTQAVLLLSVISSLRILVPISFFLNAIIISLWESAKLGSTMTKHSFIIISLCITCIQ